MIKIDMWYNDKKNRQPGSIFGLMILGVFTLGISQFLIK